MQASTVMWEDRYRWARAYRDGRLVAGRVEVVVEPGDDDRIGLAPRERRCVAARFLERLDPVLRGDLEQLVDARGLRGVRLSESLAPIELVIRDAGGEHRLTGRLEPPNRRLGPLEDIDFRVRTETVRG